MTVLPHKNTLLDYLARKKIMVIKRRHGMSSLEERLNLIFKL
jgi:hypothetical protein